MKNEATRSFADRMREEKDCKRRVEYLRARREKREDGWAETYRIYKAAKKNMSGQSALEAGGRFPATLHKYRLDRSVLSQIEWYPDSENWITPIGRRHS